MQRLAPLLAEGSGLVLTTSAANALGLPLLSAFEATFTTGAELTVDGGGSQL